MPETSQASPEGPRGPRPPPTRHPGPRPAPTYYRHSRPLGCGVGRASLGPWGEASRPWFPGPESRFPGRTPGQARRVPRLEDENFKFLKRGVPTARQEPEPGPPRPVLQGRAGFFFFFLLSTARPSAHRKPAPPSGPPAAHQGIAPGRISRPISGGSPPEALRLGKKGWPRPTNHRIGPPRPQGAGGAGAGRRGGNGARQRLTVPGGGILARPSPRPGAPGGAQALPARWGTPVSRPRRAGAGPRPPGVPPPPISSRKGPSRLHGGRSPASPGAAPRPSGRRRAPRRPRTAPWKTMARRPPGGRPPAAAIALRIRGPCASGVRVKKTAGGGGRGPWRPPSLPALGRRAGPGPP